MTSAKIYFCQQLFFIFVVIVACTFPSNQLATFSHFSVYLALILFFGLGIPHGALDISLGKKWLQPKFGDWWALLFFLGYLVCVGGVVVCWIAFPLLSFLFFLAISAFHFGASDRWNKAGWIGALEGIARGLLPITVPAYFYEEQFQNLVESSLPIPQAHLLLEIVHLFFYPGLILLAGMILDGLLRRKRTAVMNSLELFFLLVLFLRLSPFAAFLIYFCFLHSFRHILHVLEETDQPLNGGTVKWVIVEAFPATLVTLIALVGCYFAYEHETVDVPVMLNLFFISLAALTLPHMILVEASKRGVVHCE